MRVFTDPLSQHFHTIAPDLRGYGRSRTRSPFQMTDHLNDLSALLDHKNIEHCLALGWSLGGIVALELALRHPERITGLILVATAARPVSQVPRYTRAMLVNTVMAGVLNLIKPGWPWNIRTFGEQSVLRDLMTQHTPEAYRWLAKAGTLATLRTSKYAHQALAQALTQRYSRLADLERINCPCLVLYGTNDCHILSSASLETAQHLNNSQHTCYPNVAHLFPWEIPSQVNQDIWQWIHTHTDVPLSAKPHSPPSR
jgi:proline iminopeptidase